jgi:hypothetical protein
MYLEAPMIRIIMLFNAVQGESRVYMENKICQKKATKKNIVILTPLALTM